MAENSLKTGCLSMQVNGSNLQKVRVKLSREALVIQKEGGVYCSPHVEQPKTRNGVVSPTESGVPSGERKVQIYRRKVGGLGMSIRGGKESNLPIAVSKIYKDQADNKVEQCEEFEILSNLHLHVGLLTAYETGQLHEGDIIVEVNGRDMRNATHDEAVASLKKGGDSIMLTVVHSSSGSSAAASSSVSQGPRTKQDKQANGIVRSIEESASDLDRDLSSSIKSSEGPEDMMGSTSSLQSFTDNIVLPLTFASISRYMAGEDKLRKNAFEVTSMDGGASVVLYSENPVELSSWHGAIKERIAQLLDQSMNLSNSSLPSSEQIVHMGWVWERLQSTNHWNVWKRRFLTIRGPDLQIFEFPPVVNQDWLNSEEKYNLMEIVCHIYRSDEFLDKREHCFCIQGSASGGHYSSVDSQKDVMEIATHIQNATHVAVVQVESRTFPGRWRGRTIKLVLDLKRGLRLYSAEDRTLLWQYRFSFLRGSSDDGHNKILLLFSSSLAGPFDRQELEFPNMQQVLSVMHAFYAAKVSQVDPSFMVDSSLFEGM